MCCGEIWTDGRGIPFGLGQNRETFAATVSSSAALNRILYAINIYIQKRLRWKWVSLYTLGAVITFKSWSDCTLNYLSSGLLLFMRFQIDNKFGTLRTLIIRSRHNSAKSLPTININMINYPADWGQSSEYIYINVRRNPGGRWEIRGELGSWGTNMYFIFFISDIDSTHSWANKYLNLCQHTTTTKRELHRRQKNKYNITKSANKK